jgi:hypothetical protein
MACRCGKCDLAIRTSKRILTTAVPGLPRFLTNESHEDLPHPPSNRAQRRRRNR